MIYSFMKLSWPFKSIIPILLINLNLPAMKSFKAIVLQSLLSLVFIPSFAQSTKKGCLPSEMIFKNFQKQSMYLSIGASIASSRFNDKNYFDFSAWVGLNYFSQNFVEVGFKLKPTLANSINLGKPPFWKITCICDITS